MTNPLPIECATIYAQQIMESLDTYHCLDYEGAQVFGTDDLFGPALGQMFGVLVCKDKEGNTVVLKAFSGQYHRTYMIDSWVPPAFDPEAYAHLMEESEE